MKEGSESRVLLCRLAYTGSFGIPPLRKRLAELYMERYNEKVEADEIIVTTGSSGAFVVAFTSLFDP